MFNKIYLMLLKKFTRKSGADLLSKTQFEEVLEDTKDERVTKIVCTLGPSSRDIPILEKMINAGMNVARFNFTHGDHKYHKETLNNLRKACENTKKTCAVLMDITGPAIRTVYLENHKPVDIKKDQILEINLDYTLLGNSKMITCGYKNLAKQLKVGRKIYVADGNLTLEVIEIKSENSVITKVLNDFTLGERKNMNLPGTDVDLPTIGEKDENDLVEWGLKNGIDIVAASFIRCAKDVETIRDILGPKGAKILVISKIENHQGLYNFDEILKASDGIMVARGDLGMEIPPEKVFLCQKMMIDKCNIAGKPVVTATQMLETMVQNSRPTRAEATDVANAVIDGTDCVMLSGETANGNFPLDAITIMSKICKEAERCLDYESMFNQIKNWTPHNIETNEAICSAAARTALDINADLIIVLTEDGKTARYMSKYRPKQPILACSVNPTVIRGLNLSRGVIGFKIPSFVGTDALLKSCIQAAKEMGLCKVGAKAICIHSIKEDTPGMSNLMKILEIE